MQIQRVYMQLTLKNYKKSSLRTLNLRPIHTKYSRKENNQVFNQNALDLVQNKIFDVVYCDPPYNTRQYGANYSVLNYIALYDPKIEIQGKTGLIKNYFKSSFCRKFDIKDIFDNMVRNIKAKKIFISYNNEGLLKKEELLKIFKRYGEVHVHSKIYKRFRSHKQKERFVKEYIFEITT